MESPTKKPLLDINEPDDDGDMPFSGGSSAAFENEQLEQKSAEQEKEKAKRQRSDLLPVAKDILTHLQDEKTAVADIRAYMKTLGENPAAEEIQAEYRARELYLNYIGRLELWMISRLSKTPARRAIPKKKA